MTQLARRASLVVVLLLLASVGTAFADDERVLWEGRVVSERGQVPTWRRVKSFNGAAECRASALREARLLYDTESRRRYAHAGGLELKGSEVQIPIEFDWMTVTFECFPDTIDPRGPKAK